MPEEASVSFAKLLRLLRIRADLTQEELANKSGISTRSVSDLERGINVTARRDTARMLADALELSGELRLLFEASARGRLPSATTVAAVLAESTAGDSAHSQVWSRGVFDSDDARLAAAADEAASDLPAAGFAIATRTLPRDIASFTGRDIELRQLIEAASAGSAGGDAASGGPGVIDVCAIGGMAGIGKTTFVIHAAHRLADQYPDGQIFLSLHGHTPGQQPVAAADALASLLQTTGVAAAQVPPGIQERIRMWRDHLASRRYLIVLDDAVGHEQIRPLLPGTAGSLVLITSRRHLTALEDTKVISLDTPSVEEAALMLARLAGRPDLDLTDPSVAELIELCGYLPLAIGMSASHLRHHPVWTVADLVADLAAASADRLKQLSAEDLSVAVAFDLSYRDLEPQQQLLLRCIGINPGDDIDAYAAAALLDVDYSTARRELEALYDHYLLTEPARGRYRPHDLIREHARALASQELTADPSTAMIRLLDYYVHTAHGAGRHLARRIPAGVPDVLVSPPRSALALLTLGDSVSWLAAERSNLHMAADYAARHGLASYAGAIAAAMHGFLRGQGYWDQALTLCEVALEAALAAADELAEACARTDLGDILSMIGDPATATASLRRAHDLYLAGGNRLGQANALHNLGCVQQRTGDLGAARETLSRALAIQREIENQLGEASVLNNLGSVQYRSNDGEAAIESLSRALELQRMLSNRLGEANALNELGIAKQLTGRHAAAIADLRVALDLHRELGNRLGEANATRDLGRAQFAAGDYAAATANLSSACQMQRRLGNKYGQAHASRDLGRAQAASGDREAAAVSFADAIALYHGLGAVDAEELTTAELRALDPLRS